MVKRSSTNEQGWGGCPLETTIGAVRKPQPSPPIKGDEMAYLDNRKYARRVLLGKKIKDMMDIPNGLLIDFTDGTYIKIYPHTHNKYDGNSISWKSVIILNAYDKKGNVIMATEDDNLS